MAIIIAEQIYIGFQERKESNDDVLLGFATYYEENKAFEKRKSTIDRWAKPWGQWNRETNKHEKPEGVPAETINNDLLEGFKMAREVRRYGWGSGNVLWRIEDPRGFELEISSANMASIMSCATIVNGVIQGKCKWGWNTVGGSKVVLLPEDSEPYQAATEDTTRRNAKPVALKDLKPGYKVELKNGTIGQFYGSYHYVAAGYGDDQYNGSHTWMPSKRKTNFFLQDDGRLYIMSSPKVARILDDSTILTQEEAVDNINTTLRIEGAIVSAAGSAPEIVFVAQKIIKPEEYEATLVPIEYEDLNAIINHSGYDAGHSFCYMKLPIMCETEDKMLHRVSSSHHGSSGDYSLLELNRTRLLDNCSYAFNHKPSRSENYWYNSRRSYKQTIVRDINECELKEQGLYIFVLKYNNKLYSPRIY